MLRLWLCKGCGRRVLLAARHRERCADWKRWVALNLAIVCDVASKVREPEMVAD